MERVDWRRLRWRLRGAWLWPAFALACLVDGALLHLLPVQGLGTGVVPALLLAGFLNLGVVALGAPVAGRLLRTRRRDLPQMIATDYAGTGLLAALSVALLAGGLLHHAAVLRERHAVERALTLMRAAVMHDAPAGVRRNVAAADTIRVDPGRLYRSCIPTARAARPYCLLVHLDTQPPRVVFGGREPNSTWDARGY